MKRGFLRQKGSRVGRGVKENSSNGLNLEVAKDGVVPSVNVDSGNTQVAITRQSSSGLSDMDVEKDKLHTLEDTTILGSFPPLPMQVTNLAGNAPSKSSYANVTGKPSGKKLNIRTCLHRGFMEGLDAMLENGPWFIWNNSLILKKWHPDKNLLKKRCTPLMLDSYTSDMCMQSWGRLSYARVMIKIQADVELKDNIFMAMPRIKGDGYYTCNIHAEYKWKPPRCVCCKVFGHVHEECPKNIGAGATKNLKKTSQTPKGIPVRQKMGFKPKQLNPFEVLTSVDNDVDLGTNGGISNSADKGTNNVSSSNTLIGEKIDKIERQIYEGKLKVVDDDGNPLVLTGIMESDSEVEVVFDKTANLRISMSDKDGSDKGYGTNSLLEQWRDSYPDIDDYDPYDDDMYENHDMSEHLHSICDDLDIMVRGRKKK
ncbi:hypothetical protein Tco_0364164 [Tanacetum coccineum]